jgi:hypothetical protein
MRRTRAEPSFGQRADVDAARKGLLARALAESVRAGDTLLVDAGTTNLAFVRLLEDGHAAAIVTNSPRIALELGHMRITRVMLLGGAYSGHAGAVLGAQTVAEIRRLRVNLAVVGVCSVEADRGLGASDAEEAEVKAAMLAAASRRRALGHLHHLPAERRRHRPVGRPRAGGAGARRHRYRHARPAAADHRRRRDRGDALSGWLAGRWGTRRWCWPAPGCSPLTTALLMNVAGLLPLFLAAFAFGASNGVLDVSMNANASEVETARGIPTMSSFHGFFSLGGLIGAAAGRDRDRRRPRRRPRRADGGRV